MKTWMLTVAMMAVAATLTAADVAPEHSVIVDFGFRVGNESMPPGLYKIRFDDRRLFTLRHVETGRRRFFYAPVAQDSEGKDAKVTFRCYGEACLLRSITLAGTGVEYKAIEKPAKNAPAAAIVKVALRR